MQFQKVADDPRRFVRTLPEPGTPSVATMSGLVSQHPRLIHHYTFEGATPREQFRDHRGGPPSDRGGHVRRPRRRNAPYGPRLGRHYERRCSPPCGRVGQYPRRGLAVGSRVSAPSGNDRGASLEFPFAGRWGQGRRLHCAGHSRRPPLEFPPGSVERGQLMQLLEADAPLVESEGDFSFIPRHWYYVASSFRCVSRQTQVNTYAADLSQGEGTLRWLVKDEWVPGVPAISRLGIGKGFDANNANAYPWSGDLDEVAIYDAVLDQDTLGQHLKAVVGTRAGTGKP